jgi:hypothetical protein
VSERRSITRPEYEIGLHSKPLKKALALTAFLLAWAAPAQAATAAPLVPRATQSQIKGMLAQFGTPELGYVPTLAPRHYALVNFGTAATVISYTVADTRYPTGNPKERAIFVFITPWNGRLDACRKAPDGTIIVGTKKIYLDGFAASRCVLAPNGKLVKLTGKSSVIRGPALAVFVAGIDRIP